MSHHFSLLVGYATALAGWLVLQRLMPWLWPPRSVPRFPSPWLDVGLALLAAVACILIGQLYTRGWLLSAQGDLRHVVDALDQVIIFSPFPLLLLFRRQSLATAWLPTDRIWLRVLAGVGLAILASFAFLSVRKNGAPWLPTLKAVYAPAHVSHLVQVGLEDLAIAILFVRLAAALGARGAILLTAMLFVAAHVPALLEQGAGFEVLLPLLLDVALGVLVLSVLRRSADIWWFWGVHFALDMTQFHGTR